MDLAVVSPTTFHQTMHGERAGVKAVWHWKESIGWRGALRVVVGEAMAHMRLCGCCTPDWMDLPLSRKRQDEDEDEGWEYYPLTVNSLLYATFCQMCATGPEVPGSARQLSLDEARELHWWDEEECGCDYGSPHTCR